MLLRGFVANNIFVTDLAVIEIRNQLNKRNTPNSSLRLGVRASGCNGFSYVIEFEDKGPADRDLVFKFDDIQVLVDKKSILYLNGMTLDFEKTLMKSGFKFINPNEKSSCGCKKSFDI